MMDLYDRFYAGSTEFSPEVFATPEEAEAKAQQLGGTGFHSHETDGKTIYMPFTTHEQYEKQLEANNPGVDYEEGGMREELRDRLRNRLDQVLTQSTTGNSL